jgi:hypothetical protein
MVEVDWHFGGSYFRCSVSQSKLSKQAAWIKHNKSACILGFFFHESGESMFLQNIGFLHYMESEQK